MPSPADDRITRAIELLRSVEFARAVNGYVLSSDQYYALLAILEEEDAGAEDEPAKRGKKR